MQRTLAALSLLSLSLAACNPPAPNTRPGPSDTLRIPGAGTGTGRIERLVYQPVSPALPAIPAVDGPLAIRIIQPSGGSPQPRSERTIIYGSVGTGQAALEINGTPVPVAPNGAFIANLPTPQDGTWRLRAQRGSEEVTETLAHARPSGGGGGGNAGASQNAVFPTARAGVVTGGSDTLATGSDAVYARPTPTGTYRWFFPRGTRLSVLERRGNQYRVQLGDTTNAWVDADNLNVSEAGAPPAPGPVNASLTGSAAALDLHLIAEGRPFLVELTQTGAVVTVYGATGVLMSGDVAAGQSTSEASGGNVRITIPTGAMPWGYKAWYDATGSLVVRIRRAPRIDPGNPLRGRRIVIDPGHPPAGTTGPTGLYEGDANLAIALPLAEKLRARGAEVILTRTGREGLVSSTNSSQELRARVQLAVDRNADLLVSVHNNAFGEGADPFRRHGTEVYYFHPHAQQLAQTLHDAIAAVTGIPPKGALVSNLALARPTWLPSVLTESLFMPIPEQEAALRDPAFLDRLADAHVAGIEAFLRARAGGGR